MTLAPTVFGDMAATWRARVILLAPAAVLLALSGVTEDGPTICPIALATGSACPGCGMTRALAFMVRGDLELSSYYQPLAPLIAIEAAAAWVWYLLRRRERVRPLTRRAGNLIVGLTALGLVGVWMARAWSGSLPPV